MLAPVAAVAGGRMSRAIASQEAVEFCFATIKVFPGYGPVDN